MPRAILINGDEQEFVVSSEIFARFLSEEVEIANIDRIDARVVHGKDFACALQDALAGESKEPILLYYDGHGVRSGWDYGQSWRDHFAYKDLAPMVMRIKAPVFFVNNCCFAYAVTSMLEKQPRMYPFGLLAASPDDVPAVTFMTELIVSWRERKMYDPLEYPWTNNNIVWKNGEPSEFVVKGGWSALLRHIVSRKLHRFFPRVFDEHPIDEYISPAYGRPDAEEVVLLDDAMQSAQDEFYFERPRWGDKLDDLFFPPRRQLELSLEVA